MLNRKQRAPPAVPRNFRWHGRDGVTLADEGRDNGEHKLRPKPARQSSTLPRSREAGASG